MVALDHQLRRRHHLPRPRAATVQPLHRGGDGVPGPQRRRLADRGQADAAEPGDRAVVIPHDREVLRHEHSRPDHGIQDADGFAVVGGDRIRRQVAAGKERMGSPVPPSSV